MPRGTDHLTPVLRTSVSCLSIVVSLLLAGPGMSGAKSSGPDRRPPADPVETGSSPASPVLSPLEAFLAGRRDAIGRDLQKEKRFGNSSASGSFATYLEIAGRHVATDAGTEALRDWEALVQAPPESRGNAVAFSAVLRDYTIHRYGADIQAATAALVRIPTFEVEGVPSAGREPFVRARAFVDSLGRALDFEVSTHADGLAMEFAAGEGPDTLGIWTHLDVVPADSIGWTFDAWSGEVVDGVLRGRGSIDDKGPFVAALYAITALRDTGVPVRSRIHLVAGFAEETSFDCINGYLAERRPPSRNVVLDASFPVVVAEKGITWLRISSSFNRIELRSCPEGYKIEEFTGGLAANQVPAYARVRLWPVDRPASRAFSILKKRVADWNAENSRSNLSAKLDGNAIMVEAIGREAHGSTPEQGHNAIIDVVEFVYELGNSCLSPSHHLVWFLNELIREDVSGMALGIAARDSIMGRTTVNVGMVGSTMDSSWVILDIRNPRGLSSDRIVQTIRERLAPFNERYKSGLVVERIDGPLEPIYTDPGSPLVRDLLGAYSEVYGGPAAPLSIAGTTYAKKLPAAVSFGPSLPGKPELAHGANEQISLKELEDLARVYATAVWRLTRQ